MIFRRGTTIGGRYQLKEELAKGGMGAVWVAKHLQLDVDVAIKFMDPATVSSPVARARFEREAKGSAQLQYPHIVHVYDFGFEDDTPYLVMELLRGESFEDRLKRESRISVQDAVAILVPITKALRKAHEAGFVHRDLKPGNIFIAENEDEEIVKVLDFGIAKQTGIELDNSTKTGEFMGSPHYMSPEQIRDSKDIDGRSDLWSVGVILFRALTGSLPFPGDTLGAVIGNVLSAPTPVPSQYGCNLPAGADAFFQRAFARDRVQRFQSAREMAEAFALVAGVELLRGSGARRDSSASWILKDLIVPAKEAPRGLAGGRASTPAISSGSPEQGTHRISDPGVSPRSSDPEISIRSSDPEGYRRASSPDLLASGAADRSSSPVPGKMLSPRQIKTIKMQPHSGPLPDPRPPGVSIARLQDGTQGVVQGAAQGLGGGIHGVPGTLTVSPSTGDVSTRQGGHTAADGRGGGRGARSIGAKIGMAIFATAALVTVVLFARRELMMRASTSASGLPVSLASSNATADLASNGAHNVGAISSGHAREPTAGIVPPISEKTQGDTHEHVDSDAGSVDGGMQINGTSSAGTPSIPPDQARVYVDVKGGSCKLFVNGTAQGVPPISILVPPGLTRVACKPVSSPLVLREVTIAPGMIGSVIFNLGGAAPSAPIIKSF